MSETPDSVRYHMAFFQQAIDRNFGEDKLVTKSTMAELVILLNSFGSLIGRAKIEHPLYSEQLSKLEAEAQTYFENIPRRTHAGVVMNPFIVDFAQNCALGIQKISQATSMVEFLNNPPEGVKLSKQEYDKLAKENENQKQIIKSLLESRGYSSLQELIKLSKSCEIRIDENWVLAISSVNLIEAAVNKKLEALGETTDGAFDKRLDRLVEAIKKKENRDIQRMLPKGIYSEVRDKLDHASQKYHPTSSETESIYVTVSNFLKELFNKS